MIPVFSSFEQSVGELFVPDGTARVSRVSLICAHEQNVPLRVQLSELADERIVVSLEASFGSSGSYQLCEGAHLATLGERFSSPPKSDNCLGLSKRDKTRNSKQNPVRKDFYAFCFSRKP